MTVTLRKVNKRKGKKMKKILCALIVCAILLVGITTVKNDNTIIIYSSMEQFRNDELRLVEKKVSLFVLPQSSFEMMNCRNN